MVRFVECVKVLGVTALVVMAMGGTQQAAARSGTGSASAALTIGVDKPVAKVSPTLYGLMTEEINYSYDGGLYAELVQDRNFLASRSDTENWVPVPMGAAKGAVA